MKHILMGLSLLMSTMASATCYVFVNGKGPTKIGNFEFGGKALSVCIDQDDGFFESTLKTRMTFQDSQGYLAIAGVSSVSRCAGACSEMQLSSGNINGQNVDLTGTTVKLETRRDAHLNIVTGVLTIKTSRGFAEPFLVMEKPKRSF